MSAERREGAPAPAAADNEQQSPVLNDAERGEVERRMPPRAAVLHEAIDAVGEEELARNAVSLAWSGLAAGMSMGFSMVASGVLLAHLPHAPPFELLVALGYSTGFVVVILARQQLFTENTLTVVLPLMASPSWGKLGQVLRLWAIVLASNLVGVGLFALAVARLPLFGAAVDHSIAELGREVMRNPAPAMFLKAVVAGWIIATMVWLMPAAESRLWIIIGLTWLIAAAGLVHVIGSAGEVCFLVFSQQLSWRDALLQFAGPTLAGNIIGGTVIFTLISHAQIRSDSH